MSVYDSFSLLLIDKTINPPTGHTDLPASRTGTVAGDMTPFFIRCEMLHSITNRTGNLTLLLFVPPDGIFTTIAPKLLNDDAQDKYYIQAQVTQNAVAGRLFRMRIGQPTLIQEESVGEVLKVPVVGIEYIAREWPTSSQDINLDAKQRFLNVIAEFNANGGADNPKINAAPGDIDLLDIDDGVLLNWKSFAPRMMQVALKEIIDRQVEPGATGGVFTDKYIDYIPVAALTKELDVKVKDFGGVSSGITVNSETSVVPATPEKKTGISDQLARKNIVIYKFHPAGASLPMEKTRLESNFQHARLRKEWDTLKAYAKGALVKFTHTESPRFIIRYFEAVNAVGPSATNPDADNVNWKEDFTIIPPHSTDAFYDANSYVTVINGSVVEHYTNAAAVGPAAAPPNASWTKKFTDKSTSLRTAFATNSPWTNDLDAVKKTTLMGQNNIPGGYTYVGGVPDWNMEAATYDKVDYTNDFKEVSGRSCRDQQNAPPTGRNLFHGARYLVGSAGSGDWAGQDNRVATYERLPTSEPTNPKWNFSDAPVEGDTVMLEDMLQIMRFTGGAWTVGHDIDLNNDKPGPYHLCSGIRLVEDKSGIPGQAVELRFDWELALTGGDDNNRSSRGAWYYEEIPLPSRDSTNFNIGGLYGGDGISFPSRPFLDSFNLDRNRQGFIGWNRGLDAEDQGRLGVHVIAINLGFYRDSTDNLKSKGHENTPMIYTRRDLFGRTYFYEFAIPRNAEWHVIRVPIPPIGPPTQLYHNRLDELTDVLGWTVPTLFGLPEKEFSGVRFDERFAKSWGVQTKDSYSNDGLYTGTYDYIIKSLQEAAGQFIGDTIEAIDKLAHGDTENIAFFEANTNVDHTKLKIGNLYYEKEGYALSQDAAVTEPRFHIERDEAEFDYNNAKVKAKAVEIRKFELINDWHFYTAGDVNMQAGESFLVDGPNIPDGPITLVCTEVKFIIDNDKGFNMEVYAIRKRTVPV